MRFWWIGIVLVILAGCGGRPGVVQDEAYLVGAHYYSWYPGNWGRGCLRRMLEPEQEPMLGYYDSFDQAVVEQHIEWCSRYGIDFLTLDWWHGREDQSEFIEQAFLKSRNIDDVRFCIFYETWSLGFDSDIGATVFDEEATKRFIADIVGLAESFFGHPSYLRIAGRPVLFLYLSRTMAGDFESAIGQLRKKLDARGYDVFLIGDEIFWKVTPVVSKGKAAHPLVDAPQMLRIRCFDAITSYNMYENGLPAHAGYGADSSYMRDVSAKFAEYRDAAREAVYFVPGVIPGYNDRAGRLASDHHVIPRALSKDAEDGSFFEQAIERLAMKFLDERLNMFVVTSWNEWNEDTGIEPLKEAPGTAVGRGDSPVDYTCGYTYYGHGTRYLEILRDKVVAVCGRVVDSGGDGVGGVDVILRQGDVEITVRTDSAGYYRFSRLRLQPGECELQASGTSRKVTIHADHAVELDIQSNCPRTAQRATLTNNVITINQ